MTRKILLLCILLSFLLSTGCSGWHIPFFGDKEAKEEEPLVQDAAPSGEEPQYSGQYQPQNAPAQAAPAAAGYNNTYGTQPAYGTAPATAPAYGQNPAGGAFQPGQPYNPNANYAAAATPGYGNTTGAYGAAAQPYGAQPYNSGYGAPGAMPGTPGTPYGAQPAAGAYGAYPPAPGAQPGMGGTPGGITPYGQGVEQENLGGQPQGSFLGTPPPGDSFAFGGIKRKVLFIISYPQRGLSATPYDSFSRQIYQRLSASAAINMVPREAVDQVSQQFFSQTLDARSRLSRLGQELGAQAIILERIQYAGFNPGGYGYQPAQPRQQYQLQLIDTATGYPIKSYTIVPNNPAGARIIDSLVNDVRMIDWSARVIKAEKKRIMINAGRLTGLQPGQNLRVYAKGSEVKDPTTKLSLGLAQGALKGTIKVIDFFGIDGAICKPVANGNFKQGDIVKAVE